MATAVERKYVQPDFYRNWNNERIFTVQLTESHYKLLLKILEREEYNESIEGKLDALGFKED